MIKIAQLIKLLDYISRYETNPFHYPTQYIRLKQENWKKFIAAWEKEMEIERKIAEEEEKKHRFSWIPFQKKEVEEEPVDVEPQKPLPQTREQLIKYFLDELYPFQLKWASSTISHVSYTDPKFNHDPTLKFFLQRFPDIYLLMYYPIFNIKKAPIEGEIILISPIDIEIIVLIDDDPNATIVASDDRTWVIETEDDSRKMISPLISLKRTEQIVKSILNHHQVHFNIQKTVLSQTSQILYSTQPYKTSLIGKREFDDWFEQKRNLSSPLKSEQLKAVEALLMHCQTTSVRRPEWERDDDHLQTMIDEEL